MPTYEYQCLIGHPYSEVRSMSEPQDRTTCPKPDCSKELIRVFSSAPTIFKGKGFYSTGG